MFLTLPRHEILADLGISTPYTSKWLYDLCAWRDQDPPKVNPLTSRVLAEFAFIGLVFVSIIENVVRLPFAILSGIFSKKYENWMYGLSLSILTTFFALSAVFINLFARKVSIQLMRFDAVFFQAPWQDRLLYQACEKGHFEIAKWLKENCKANFHRVDEIGYTAALAPHLMGYTHLDPLFEYNEYERDCLELKLLSHWLGLKGDVSLCGNEFTLEGAPSRWLFESLAESFQRFRTLDEFDSLMLKQKNAEILQNALFSAYHEHSYEKIAKKIQNKELCFVDSGWKQHALCLCFCDDYIAIGNRGEGSEATTTLDVYKIDSSLMSPDLIEEIWMQQYQDASSGKEYFYKTLPGKLSRTGKPEKDAVCNAFQEIAPHYSKGGVCALASKKAALRFAWGMLISKPPTKATIERTRLETKLYTDWAAFLFLDSANLAHKFPTLTPKEDIIGQAYAKGHAKLERFKQTRRRLTRIFI